jgi:transposase-like protein
MMYAARRSDCEAARVRFAAEYQDKYPKAVESLTANCERLVSFFRFSRGALEHLRTTNDRISVRHRALARATKGVGSRTTGLLMAFKLLDIAQQRWRRLNAAILLPLVRAGVKFVGIQKASAKRYSTKRQPATISRLIMRGPIRNI